MDNPVIVSAVRTPIGKFLGTLAGIQAPRLGALAVKEAVLRAGVKPEQIDEVIMGNVVGAGLGQNPARQAAIFGGIPDTVPAMTVNKVCGSSLKAVVLATQAIKCGDAEIVVAGGMESMSNAPLIMKNARVGFRMGNQPSSMR
jgi:acetyl-CoA C-acetyltransferase